MPKLPVVSGKKVIKALSKIGYKHERTKGSHAILNKKTEKSTRNHNLYAKGIYKP